MSLKIKKDNQDHKNLNHNNYHKQSEMLDNNHFDESQIDLLADIIADLLHKELNKENEHPDTYADIAPKLLCENR